MVDFCGEKFWYLVQARPQKKKLYPSQAKWMCSQGNGWKSYAKIWIYKNLSHDPSPSLNLQRVFVPIYSSFLKIYYLDPPPPLPPHFLASI